jgi:hypothetical protein
MHMISYIHKRTYMHTATGRTAFEVAREYGFEMIPERKRPISDLSHQEEDFFHAQSPGSEGEAPPLEPQDFGGWEKFLSDDEQNYSNKRPRADSDGSHDAEERSTSCSTEWLENEEDGLLEPENDEKASTITPNLGALEECMNAKNQTLLGSVAAFDMSVFKHQNAGETGQDCAQVKKQREDAAKRELCRTHTNDGVKDGEEEHEQEEEEQDGSALDMSLHQACLSGEITAVLKLLQDKPSMLHARDAKVTCCGWNND